jgi:ABC-2 type transport system ATP-binding protein
MRSATDLAIETRGLTRVFGALRAVDNLDLAIPRGSIFGLLGPNGSGKTTPIRLLLGILESTAGSARVLGFDTRSHAQDIRTRCGALLEHNGLYERLNAWNNLELFARIWGMRRDERQSRVEELLERGAARSTQRARGRLEPGTEAEAGHRARPTAPPRAALPG